MSGGVFVTVVNVRLADLEFLQSAYLCPYDLIVTEELKQFILVSHSINDICYVVNKVKLVKIYR